MSQKNKVVCLQKKLSSLKEKWIRENGTEIVPLIPISEMMEAVRDIASSLSDLRKDARKKSELDDLDQNAFEWLLGYMRGIDDASELLVGSAEDNK